MGSGLITDVWERMQASRVVDVERRTRDLESAETAGDQGNVERCRELLGEAQARKASLKRTLGK